MSYTYGPNELQQFLDGCADTVPGPLGGIMPHRVPLRYRSQIEDPWCTFAEFCPSGVHVDLRITAPTTIALEAYELEPGDYRLSILRHAGGAVHVEDVPVQTPGALIPDVANGSYSLRPGTPMKVQLDPANSDDGVFTVILSHTCLIELLGIESEQPVQPVGIADDTVRWVHYGSSISHGAQVASPARRWPEQVARALGIHLQDLSLSGNAQMDPCMARAIADSPADVITCAIGVNITNADSMRERFFIPALHGFLDTIRDKHPDTPLYLVTACSCPIQEHTPGPTIMKPDRTFVVVKREVENDAGALTLQRTRELIEHVAQRRSDEHLTVVDGRTFFGPDDTDLLLDNLHPGPEGVDLIAQRVTAAFAKVLPGIRHAQTAHA